MEVIFITTQFRPYFSLCSDVLSLVDLVWFGCYSLPFSLPFSWPFSWPFSLPFPLPFPFHTFQVIELARIARSNAPFSLRIPAPELTIVVKSADYIDDLRDLVTSRERHACLSVPNHTFVFLSTRPAPSGTFPRPSVPVCPPSCPGLSPV